MSEQFEREVVAELRRARRPDLVKRPEPIERGAAVVLADPALELQRCFLRCFFLAALSEQTCSPRRALQYSSFEPKVFVPVLPSTQEIA